MKSIFTSLFGRLGGAMETAAGSFHAIKKRIKAMENTKKYMVILPLSAVTVFVSLPEGADAQFVVGQVLQQTVGRVIRAIDLEVQRMQNQTIWLQNAQKALENQLSKMKLAEISGWSEKQQELYGNYYNELWQVKAIISDYERIKHITEKQAGLISQYHHAWGLLQSDRHFKPEELAYMQKVYSGILQQSITNLDEVLVVISSMKTQMDDAKRMELVARASERIDQNCADLKRFNNQNYILSLQRAKSQDEVETLKKYYGID